MSCRKPDRGKAEYQPYPHNGRLMGALNVNLATVSKILLAEVADVYCYVVASIKCRDGRFVQTGSAPNFQGGVITLCTCKHQMRSRRDINSWPGQWIAGFTGIGAVDRGNYLVYLMRVSETYASHQQLWFSRSLPHEAKLAKAAHLHRLGDLYKPGSAPGDPYTPRSYVAPRPDHSHAHDNEWYRDIDYGRRRPAALLVGHRDFSFLWDSPALRLPFNLPRDYTIQKLPHLLEQLEAKKSR